MKLLTLLLGCALAWPAFAQDAIPNGYQAVLDAGKLILPDENGSPLDRERDLPPAENLRRQRLAVARNAPALKRLRDALKLSITTPEIQNQSDMGSRLEDFNLFRALANQLRQESDVRAADGDWTGALDSRLTAIELGAAVTCSAAHFGMLVGVSLESVGRRDFGNVASHLDAEACRVGLKRLKAVDDRRATFIEVMEVEKETFINMWFLTFNALPVARDREKLATPEGRAKAGVTDAEAAEVLALNATDIAAELEKSLDDVIARDRLPFIRARKAVLPPATGKYAPILTDMFRQPGTRFPFERNLTEQRLVEGALELRALKLETGAYPASFEAPYDPFGDGSRLIYERDGDKYLLYSIGPDGKNDNGAEIQTLVAQRETGIKTVSSRLALDSLGDILAPIF